MNNLYMNRGQFQALSNATCSLSGWFSSINGEWYWYQNRWYRIGFGPKD